jgi:hypothetical protein
MRLFLSTMLIILIPKKQSIPLLLLMLLPVSANSGHQQKNNRKIIGATWTATVSIVEKLTGEAGTSERHVDVTFNNALPTLYRDDTTTNLDFTDDKGTGTASYHSESIIGGKIRH